MSEIRLKNIADKLFNKATKAVENDNSKSLLSTLDKIKTLANNVHNDLLCENNSDQKS